MIQSRRSHKPIKSEDAGTADGRPIIFVVDDDVSIRESVESLLECAGWRAETFSSAQDFLDRPKYLGPSCLVLDFRLPGLSGLELQRIMAADSQEMPIIFITGYGDVPISVQAMKAGAVEFLTKPFTDTALLDAVQHAIARSRTMCKRSAEVKLLRNAYASLTPRERDVMALVVAGLLNKQVGGELDISEITVKAHRARVMKKMHAASLPDLVKTAARLDLTPVHKL